MKNEDEYHYEGIKIKNIILRDEFDEYVYFYLKKVQLIKKLNDLINNIDDL